MINSAGADLRGIKPDFRIKIFDVKPYLDIGLFKTLKDEKLFNRVKIVYDTIEWPNGVDLDPEVLYEKSNYNE